MPVYDKRPCRPATSGLVEGVGEGRGGDTPYPLQGYPRKLPPAIGRLAVHRPPRNATPRAPLAAMIALPAPLSPRYVARRPPFE